MPRSDTENARAGRASAGPIDVGATSAEGGFRPDDATSLSRIYAGANLPLGGDVTVRPQIFAQKEATPSGRYSGVTPSVSVSRGSINLNAGIDRGKFSSPDESESFRTPFYGAGVHTEIGNGTARYNATVSPHSGVHHSMDYSKQAGPGRVSIGGDSDGTRNLGGHLRYKAEFATGGPTLGGPLPHFEEGGSPRPPWLIRHEAQEIQHPGGLINSTTAGRTDRLPLSVATNSYVMPADVVSGLGQGNTLAGAKTLEMALKVGPYGTALPRSHGGGRGLPGAAHAPHYASGGAAGRTSILAAGGEYIVHADDVLRIGGGSFKAGHRLLDQFVKSIRTHTAKQLRKLPGPKR